MRSRRASPLLESVAPEVQAAIDALMYGPTSQEADAVRLLHSTGHEDSTVESLIEQLGGDPYIEQAIHLTYATIDALLKRGLVSYEGREVKFLPTVAASMVPTVIESTPFPVGTVRVVKGAFYEQQSEGVWTKVDWFP
jgi:hypothetical protein